MDDRTSQGLDASKIWMDIVMWSEDNPALAVVTFVVLIIVVKCAVLCCIYLLRPTRCRLDVAGSRLDLEMAPRGHAGNNHDDEKVPEQSL